MSYSGLPGHGGFFPGNRHSEVGVVLLPCSCLGPGVTLLGSLIADATLVIPAIWVLVWWHVVVIGPVGSHRISPPPWSAKYY